MLERLGLGTRLMRASTFIFNLYFFIFLWTCFFLDYFICYQSKIDTDLKNAKTFLLKFLVYETSANFPYAATPRTLFLIL